MSASLLAAATAPAPLAAATAPAPPAPRTGLRPAPLTDPPYDDELSHPEGLGDPEIGRDALAVTLPGLDCALWPPTVPASVRVPPTVPAARDPAPVGGTPAPGPRAVMVVRALLEVLAGVRPPSQLNGWVTPALGFDLDQRRRPSRAARPATLLSLRVSEPMPGVAEVSAVVRRPGPEGRSGALALRMDLTEERWVVSRLAVG